MPNSVREQGAPEPASAPPESKARKALLKRLADVVSLPASRVNAFERAMTADLLVEMLREAHPDERARVAVQRDGGRRGVAVRVVRADADQGDRRSRGGEELRIGVRAAVVRNLEDVGAQVDPGTPEPRFGLRAEVAGQQQPDAVDGDPTGLAQAVVQFAGTGHIVIEGYANAS